MSRIWTESYLPENSEVKDVNSPIGKVLARKMYFVEVCSFQFQFDSLNQIKEVLQYFEQKLHPSSRLPDKEWLETEARQNPKNYRRNIANFIAAEHDLIQRWYERLPMWLYEEPRRKKIVKALNQALEKFGK